MAIEGTLTQLLPPLLSRLLDDDPHNQVPEPNVRHGLDADGFRDAVMEDLRHLLNTIAWPESDIPSLAARPGRSGVRASNRLRYLSPDEHPEVADSVINFGVPPTYDYWESTIGMQRLQRLVTKAIQRFEPRIQLKPNGVTVLGRERIATHPNLLALRIEGTLLAKPIPIELVIRSDLDVERREAQLRVLEEVR